MPADHSAGLDLPAPRDPSGPYRVCLVCLGNICRSPMAEVALTAELEQRGLAGRVQVDSAGTGDWHLGEQMHAEARAELSRRGYNGSAHRARQFEPSWFGHCDLIAAMDQANLADLRSMAPDAGAAARIRMFRSFDPALAGVTAPGQLRVPDPYNGTADDFGLVFGLVQRAAGGLAAELAARLEAGPG
jgi:protein-tyrosine phosphatase